MKDRTGNLTHVDFGGALEARESHPAGKGVSPRDRALLNAMKWSKRLDMAREEYVKAITESREQGWSYVQIGKAVEKTEAAVRRMIKRSVG